MFLFLNGIHSPIWDVIFRFITSRESWVPLFLILFWMFGVQLKWKTIYIIAFIGVVFALGDQISVKLFKNVFERLRPCHNDNISHLVHLVSGCGGKFSFVSSHATNSFAIAVFTGILLKKYYRFALVSLLSWAAIVSYSRIYVGVHYPGDILCGALLGTIIALFVYLLFKKLNKKFHLELTLDK